ncbi:TPA: G5 domain-containing protein [Streptococcus suis]|nr:G5 domain-containing protein [Streptococcus suis]
MISKKCKFCLRKLTIGLVSLSIGLICLNSTQLSSVNSFTVYANEVISHRNDVDGSSKDWGTLNGNQFVVDYTDTSLEISKGAHSSLTENYQAIRIPEAYPYKLLVNGQPKTLSDFRRDKLGKLIAEIDGREVPLLDYGMVEYQLNRYLGQDIYNIYGNLSYTAYAFLTSRNSHHGYFELTEAGNVRDTNGQLVTGFFQTPQYYEMASAYQKSNAGYLKVQVGDKELSTNIIDGRLKGLKSATKKYFLVLNSEFSIEPQTGKSIKHLKELTEEEVQQLNLTDQKVNSNIEFIIDGKTYKTSGRINSWKNSTINPLKTRLAIMSIGDGSNLHGFDLFASNHNYIEVVEKVDNTPVIPESISKKIEYVTEDGEKVGDGHTITGNKGDEVTLEVTPPNGYVFSTTPPTSITLKDNSSYQIIVNEVVGQETVERKEEINYQVIRQENSEMYEDEEVIVSKGSKGIRIIQETFETRKGTRTQKLLDTKTIINKEAVDEIIQYGTKQIEDEQVITRTEIVPFDVIEESDPNMYEGEVVIVTEGQNGEVTIHDHYKTFKGVRDPEPFNSESTETKIKVNKVVRIGTKKIEGETTEKNSVITPFGVLVEEDDSLFEDERIIVRNGVPGLVDLVTTYKTNKGEKVGDPINISENVVRAPVDEVVKVGTKPIESITSSEKLLDIPFEVEKKIDDTLEEGIEKTIQEGKNGQKRVIVVTNYLRGVQNGDVQIEEEVILEPVKEIILVGTKKVQKQNQTPNKNETDDNSKSPILPQVTEGENGKPKNQESNRSVSDYPEKSKEKISQTQANGNDNSGKKIVAEKLPETGDTVVNPFLVIVSSLLCLVTSIGMIMWKDKKSDDK